MNQISTELASLLAGIDFRQALTHSLADLQKTLQKQEISPTSQLGLQAYQLICQEYINMAQRMSSHDPPQRHPSKPISVSQLLKIQKKEPNAFANKQQALMKVAKRHHLRRLMLLAKVDEESVRHEDIRARKALRMETAKFHFRMHVARKFLTALRLMQAEGKEMEAKAEKLLESKQEAILEEYFLAWRDEALMGEAERAFRDELENNYEFLAKVLFLRRFRLARQAIQSQKQLYKQQEEQLHIHIQVHRITGFFRSLQKNVRSKDKLDSKLQQLNLLRKKQVFTSFLRTLKKVILYRTISEEKRELFINKTLYPKLLLRKMKGSLQLRKVYYKNSKKIIFLAMLLEQIKQCLLRKGYEHEWMNDLTKNVEFTDRKLGSPYRKRCLSRVFKQFRDQLQAERSKMEVIKHAKGGQILKQLIYNYKLSILKQKQQHKVDNLHAFLAGSMAVRAFAVFQQCYALRKKQEQLAEYLILSKAKQGMQYLKIFYRSSKFYGCRLESFQRNREKNQLQIIFHALKRVLLTERVNNRLVKQYQSYINRIKTEKIFQCLKDYCFSEQLIKKRQRNVTRIRLSRYADQFFYNLKVDLYAHTKGRLTDIGKSQASVRSLRASNALKKIANRFRQGRMAVKLYEQVDKEYELRFKWRMFNLLKVITHRRQAEQAKVESISARKGRRLKEFVLDKMLTKLLLSLLLKRISGGLEKKLLKSAWDILAEGQFELTSIREQGCNEEIGNTSARMTSQFRLASPSFELSSDKDQGM